MDRIPNSKQNKNGVYSNSTSIPIHFGTKQDKFYATIKIAKGMDGYYRYGIDAQFKKGSWSGRASPVAGKKYRKLSTVLKRGTKEIEEFFLRNKQ